MGHGYLDPVRPKLELEGRSPISVGCYQEQEQAVARIVRRRYSRKDWSRLVKIVVIACEVCLAIKPFYVQFSFLFLDSGFSVMWQLLVLMFQDPTWHTTLARLNNFLGAIRALHLGGHIYLS